jgi:DNA-directed RNA polymerase subunit RPC12/RpoP
MKCIHCSTDNTYKERTTNGQKCKSCGHRIAFEPKTDVFQISDALFAGAIKDVSADGTLAFTPRQLWYEINRRLLARKTISCGRTTAMLLLGAVLFPHLKHLGPGMLTALAAPALLMATVTPKKPKPAGPRYPRMTFEKFDGDYLKRWIDTHGAVAKLLPPPNRNSSARSFGQPAAPDVTAYSFDRALVTDHADIAAMLVANNFHFENNCAILSLDGYPYHSADTIKTMLQRNPNLKVFALHDASLAGVQMGSILRGPNWFPDRSIRLIDLGLRPLHILKGGLIALASAPIKFPVGTTSTALTPEEIAWLEQGNVAELHTLRPNKLMRAVYQGFARAGQTDSTTGDSATGGDDSVIIVDSGPSIWIYDGGMDVYASDSFG